ncbi:hypothetical protein ACFL01_00040 [Planctomycetota bacterium]
MEKKPQHTRLREVKYVSQHAGEPFRRVFCCSRMDIYVWFEESGEIYGFQLCYRQNREEKALTWLQDKGFTHRSVDDGEDRGGRFKMTPVLMPDGVFAREDVVASFEEISEKIDSEIVGFILKKVDEYSA